MYQIRRSLNLRDKFCLDRLDNRSIVSTISIKSFSSISQPEGGKASGNQLQQFQVPFFEAYKFSGTSAPRPQVASASSTIFDRAGKEWYPYHTSIAGR